MIILTAANSDVAKDDTGKLYKNFSFRGVIQKTIKKSEECGYKVVVYDLGSLGIGKSYHIIDETFMNNGFYKKEIRKGYKSKSLFKPEIVKKCMEEHNEFMVYLDGDAQLCSNLDEVDSDEFDIGVTLRDPYEFTSDWYKEHIDIVRYVNAGVIFFRPTTATKIFIDKWQKLTEDVGNDQKALNQLVCPEYYPKYGSVVVIDGVRIKYFSGKQYNYYYFERGIVPNIKIMHFKGSVRHFYPFDWKKRAYCMMVIPAKNLLRDIIKKTLLQSL